jgi:hypothetical protein
LLLSLQEALVCLCANPELLPDVDIERGDVAERSPVNTPDVEVSLRNKDGDILPPLPQVSLHVPAVVVIVMLNGR